MNAQNIANFGGAILGLAIIVVVTNHYLASAKKKITSMKSR